MSWTITHHAEVRMTEMQIGAVELLETLTYPSITYPSPPSHGPGRSIAVAGRLAVVVNTSTCTVITVLWHGQTGRSSHQLAA